MSDRRQRKRNYLLHIPLQWVIVFPFVVQIVGAVGLVGYFSYQSGQQAVENIVSQLLKQTSARVDDRLDIYLHAPQQVVSLNNLAVQQKLIDIEDIEQVRKQLWQQIKLDPALVGNGFLSDKAMAISYIRLFSQEFQKLAAHASGRTIPLGTVILSENDLTHRRYYAIDNQGNAEQLLLEFQDDFRLTPWYIDAQRLTTQAWTPISLGRVLRLLQVFAIHPVYDQQNQRKGFFTAQYFLTNISLFLNQLKFTPTGQIFIIESSGDLVATSVSTEVSGLVQVNGKSLRLNAMDSQDRTTREVARQLKQKFGDFRNLSESHQTSLIVDGSKKFVQVDHYQDRYGLDWYVVTVIPEADFIGELQNNLYQTLVLCLFTLLVSVSVGIWASRRITRSLSSLTTAAKSFAEDHLEPDLPQTRIAEIQILSEAIQQMLRELKEADQLRLSYAKDLEHQVKAKTAALIESQRIARMGSWEFDIATGTNIWSEAQFQILGFDPAVPLPTRDDSFTLLPEEDRPKMRAVVEEAIAQGKSYMVEHGIIRPDGSICYVISRGEPVFDEQGQIVKLVGTIVDISDRKRIEMELIAKESQFQQLAAASPSVIYTVVEELHGPTRFEFVSPAFSEIHELPLTDAYRDASVVFAQFHPDDLPAYLAAVSKSLETMTPFHHEWRIITPSGKTKWLQANSRPSRRANGETVWHGVVSDISNQKQIATALAQAKLAAEEATRAKSAFLASMSHEIRTPMNGIIGVTQLLQSTALDAEQQDFVQTIQDSGESLLTIINDILDFSKIESQKLDLESAPFHLEQVVTGVCKILGRQVQDKNLVLRYAIAPDTPTTFIGDRLRLRQILLNLVGNALKFTQAGEILISVSSSPVSDPTNDQLDSQLDRNNLRDQDNKYQLKFEIADTGIGIAGDRMDQLFQPFTQADASISRKYGGTGLGLAISKRLVELMGGKIWVESFGQVSGEPDQGWQPYSQTEGATFYFTVIVDQDRAIDASPVNADNVDLYNGGLSASQAIAQKFPLQILLVEDNKVNQMIANKFLKKLGYKIDIVNNGYECLQAIQTKSYDLIFMDLQMPEMDGLTATKLIRERLVSNGGHIQIVAMTANAMAEDRQICLDAGMDDYVSKPINLQKIIGIVSKTYCQSHHV